MITPMGPPPSRNDVIDPDLNPESSMEPEFNTAYDEPKTSENVSSMGPPPPIYLTDTNPDAPEHHEEEKESSSNLVTANEDSTVRQAVKQNSVPYSIPDWSGPPCHHFYLEVLKDGSIINQSDVCEKGAYMFGRADICDFVLEHPTISRFHAVLQFNKKGDAYIYDLGSTHGTSVNKNQVEKRIYVDLCVGDVIRFGRSTRLYIFEGPQGLMPPEKDLKIIRNVKSREDLLDREASLRRAKQAASLADGISWGMEEDAIEEIEDDMDEVTWQTYKGQLTEKQEKTREKVIKRTEKIGHMKKEINSIRAKDISQGGLTQGQQTQIARNEQRISQLLEELENLEETLNDSIRESLGARSGKVSKGKKKGTTEEEEELLSDDDDFYDRTRKKSSIQKGSETPSIETADTLLDKRDATMKEIEEKKESITKEKNKVDSETAAEPDAGDSLDAYMSGLSSRLVLDKTVQLQSELSALQSELARISYLLKIADPAGEASKKRDLKLQEAKHNRSKAPAVLIKKPSPVEQKSSGSEKVANVSLCKEDTADSSVELNKKPEAEEIKSVAVEEKKTTAYVAVKPQWLGAVDNKEIKETKQRTEVLDTHDPDEFVDYKDRNKVLANVDESKEDVDTGIENAAPGLILRKRKQVEKSEDISNDILDPSISSSTGAEVMAQDAVALLLRHSQGYHAVAAADEDEDKSQHTVAKNQHSKDSKKSKRVLGPERPSFLDKNTDQETWVPPEGQSGDGRTSLNDRYGY